jgi:4-carboxymuconolactone decarboxylase
MRLPLFCALVIGALGVSSAQTSSKQAPAKQAPDPRSVVLQGDRFKPLKWDEMTPAQKTMIEHLFAGERHGANGPFNVLLRSPEVGDLAAEFGGAARFRSSLPRDVSETIIILTARYWMAQYEWNSHKNAALQNGVKPEIVEAIKTGKRPTGMPPEMEVAYNFIDELLTTHQVTDATFNAAKDKYGERGISDMIALSGWYCLVSMALNTDRYPMPAGVPPDLKAMENPLPVAGTGFATPVPGTPSPKSAQSKVNGKQLNLRGDRFKPLTYEEMTPAQKKYTEAVVAGRGPGASFNLLLRSPETGELFFNMGDRVRSHMEIPDKIKELGLAITARYWTAQLEWLSHSRSAIQAGFSEENAKAIAEGRRPTGMAADEEAAYNFLTELYKTRQVSDANFAALKKLYGERGVVDLLVSSAYYQVVSMFMNTDRLPLGANQQPALKYLAKPLP